MPCCLFLAIVPFIFLFAVEFTMILRHELRSWRHSENDRSVGPPKSEKKASISQKPLTQKLPPRPGPSKPSSFCLQKWIWCAAKHLPTHWTVLSGRSQKDARANAGTCLPQAGVIRINKHRRDALADRLLEDLTMEDINRWIAEQTTSASTITAGTGTEGHRQGVFCAPAKRGGLFPQGGQDSGHQ